MLRWLTHALFPLTCVGCGREKTVACDACLSGVRFFEGTCAVAGIDDVIALYSYSDPVVQGILRQAKFHGVDSTQNAIVRLVDKGLARCGIRLPKGDDVIVVFVPTTARHIRERGFDQAEWMAAVISASLDAPIVRALRADHHERQSHLGTDAARRKNVRGMLHIVADVRGKRVVLVDDVVTSGATMAEAARVLREAGASSVTGVALARGGKKQPG